MKTLYITLRDTAAKRALYRRTRDQLASLSLASAADIGIDPADAKAVARLAVWG